MLITIEREPGADFEHVDDSVLVKTEGQFEDENEVTCWVEYRFPGTDRIVHRSVHVHLKQGLFAAGVAADFG